MMGGSVVALDGKVITMGLPPNVPLPPIPIYQFYQKNETTRYILEELSAKGMSRYIRGK
jgi:hypothetical protein